ncbi:MAG: hypothetical protein KDD48_09315, partial [Bdellovibrionales bacterium]|nr:hypothetical protein [Bdellovibrionales bacterium]
ALSPSIAKNMVKVREARRAYRRFYAQCFWSYDPNYKITLEDIPWVAKTLMKNGNHETWSIGAKLCR